MPSLPLEKPELLACPPWTRRGEERDTWRSSVRARHTRDSSDPVTNSALAAQSPSGGLSYWTSVYCGKRTRGHERVSNNGDNAMRKDKVESADHRVRVARERRERMRARLLEALMHVYAGHLEEGPPSVDSVIRQADVSRATFYKYFNSVEEAISALGRELVDEMIANLINLYNPRDAAFFRMTGAIQLFLLRSVIDPTWAAFVGRSDGLARDGELFRGITTHLAQSRESHLVEFKNLEAATTVAIGSLMEAIRHLAVTRNPSREYIEEVTVMILRALGLDADQAAETVRDRTIYIRGLAPDRLPWWRDPWS